MTIGLLLPLLTALFVFFLLASASLPDEVPAEGLKLSVYYFDNARYFWVLFALFVVLAMAHVAITSYAMFADEPRRLARLAGTIAPNAVVIGLALSLAFVRRAWWHSVGLTLLLAALLTSHLARPLT